MARRRAVPHDADGPAPPAADPRALVVDIEHVPWPLQRATARLDENTMAASVGFDLVAPAPVLHFARRLDVVSRPMVRAV